MIILISGTSCTGKTFMAQKLLEKYKVPYLSIDNLKMGIYRGASNCGFTPVDSTELIGEKLWPIIKGIIMTNIENDQHLIIEGCYILPHFIKDFEREYSEKIISVFLGFSSNYLKQNFESKLVKHRNIIESRGPEERTFIEYINAHDEFRRKCFENSVPYFEIDKDYEEEIIEVYDYIETQKRKIESKF